MKRKITLTVLFFTLLICSAWAEKIIFSANSMSGKSGDSNTTTKLSGNAYIKTSSMEISAEEVVLSGEDYRYIKATGKVSGKNTETNMDSTCEELSYDRTTKVAELKGDVTLNDLDNDVKAQAQIIIYDQNKEVAVLQIKINLTQEDNICSGSYAVYYKENQILELSGNAQIKQKEDTFRAQHITLDMDTQDITLGGNVRGSVKDTGDDKDTETTDESKTQDESKIPETNAESKVNEESGLKG